MRVLKFGGTSVGSAASLRSLVEIVRSTTERYPAPGEPGRGVLVVVSAASKVTDMLLAAARGALQGAEVEALLGPLVEREQLLLREVGLPEDMSDAALGEVRNLLQGIRLLGELTPRTLDRVASYGELMSAARVAGVFRLMGLPSTAYPAWELGMLTDSTFGEARLLPEAAEAMAAAWKRLPVGEVPITTGFIGRDPRGAVTTLGRGGSDLSASLLGAGMGAQDIQIWTDVSGIQTCDPRVVPQARLIPTLSFAEAAELAFFGAKVLHPRTIEPATRVGIPVRVLNTFAPDDPGSMIVAEVTGRPGSPIGLAARRRIQVLTIHSSGMLGSSGFMARLFGVFAEHGVTIDVIATSEVNVSVTVDLTPDRMEPLLAELRGFAHVAVQSGQAIICLVGEGLRDTRGMAGRIFTVMGEAGVNIEMISQGASQINVTFVVHDHQCETALRALHRHFFES